MGLDIKDLGGGKALHVRVTDKLTKDDYRRLVPEVEKRIEAAGKLRILLEMHDFHGWEISATWEDLKFDWKHYGDIERLAMVGDRTWEKWMAAFCKPFTTATIEYFDIAESQAAHEWVLAD